MIFKKRGNWKVYDIERYGNPFKLLIQVDDKENIIQTMEKPNFKRIEKNILTSGAHTIPLSPERNHLDYYKDGEKVKIEETPNEDHIVGIV